MSQPDDKPGLPDDTPITLGMLESWGLGFIDIVKKEIGGMQKGQTDNLLNIVSQNVAQQLDPLIDRVNQLTAFVNQGGAGGQPEQPQAAASRRNTINDILNSPLGAELLPVIKQRLGITESADPAVQEFRNNTERLNQIVYRKAANLTAKMIEKAMKVSLNDDFTNSAAKDMAINAVANHEPL